MKTYFAKKENQASKRRWRHVDADGKILGRMATRIAMVLMGKDRPEYTPHVDTGAYVVVTNAEKVRITGKKEAQKVYRRYSGYPGGLKEIPFEKMMERKPEEVIRLAVRRMLPKSRLGSRMIKKLKVYRGSEHPHAAHKPVALDV